MNIKKELVNVKELRLTLFSNCFDYCFNGMYVSFSKKGKKFRCVVLPMQFNFKEFLDGIIISESLADIFNFISKKAGNNE